MGGFEGETIFFGKLGWGVGHHKSFGKDRSRKCKIYVVVLQFVQERFGGSHVSRLKTDVSGYNKSSIRNAVSFALSSAVTQARQRYKLYAQICQSFEKKHGMTSDEFINKFDSGLLGDGEDFFDWYASKRGLDIWHERFVILSGVSV